MSDYPRYEVSFQQEGQETITVTGSHRIRVPRTGGGDITLSLSRNDENNDTFPRLIVTVEEA
jgi:hypothetical protein